MKTFDVNDFIPAYSTLIERQKLLRFIEERPKIQATQEVLQAFTKALNAGVDPDALMRKIIERGIEVVRGNKLSKQ